MTDHVPDPRSEPTDQHRPANHDGAPAGSPPPGGPGSSDLDHAAGWRPTVRLRDLPDLIAAVPYMLTYVPQDAVVLMVLDGPRLKVTAALPLPISTPAAVTAAQLNALLSRALDEGPPAGGPHGSDSTVSTGATDGHTARAGDTGRTDPLYGPDAGPHRPGATGAPTSPADCRLLVLGYGAQGIEPMLAELAFGLAWPVLDVVRVHDGRWWCLTCSNPMCCPPGARLIPDDRVTVGLLAGNGAPAPSRAARARELDPEPAARLEEVLRLLPDLGLLTRRPDPAVEYERLAVAKAVRADRRVPLSPEQAGPLLLALRDSRVRDACFVWTDLAALHLWHDLLAMAPQDWAAPVATLLAMTAYQRGDSPLANLAIDRALTDAPDYRMAALFRQALVVGIPPTRITADLQALSDQLLAFRPDSRPRS